MFSFCLKRGFVALRAILACSLLVFVMIRVIPGDPVDHILGERGGDPSLRQAFMEKWGFHRPVGVQYALFVFKAFRGDLGVSVISGRSVLSEFKEHFPATLELGLFSLLLALFMGIPLGFLAALKVNSLWDMGLSSLCLTGYSMSVFWWGLVLILVLSVYGGLTPVSGRGDALYDITPVTGLMLVDAFFQKENALLIFQNGLKHLILPVLTLSTIPLVHIMRITRFSFLEVFKEDFIRTGRAKGLGFFRLHFIHAFSNALLPLISVTGVLGASLLTGAVLTETVFAWPGLGRWLVGAVLARDWPVLQGGILLVTVFVVSLNFLTDLIYFKIDPRIRTPF